MITTIYVTAEDIQQQEVSPIYRAIARELKDSVELMAYPEPAGPFYVLVLKGYVGPLQDGEPSWKRELIRVLDHRLKECYIAWCEDLVTEPFDFELSLDSAFKRDPPRGALKPRDRTK